MPSGQATKIPIIMSAISNRHRTHARIQCILDVGIGWGKYGLLCREYLSGYDAMKNEEDWKLQLDGVEVCHQYIKTYIRTLYTHVWPLDIREFCDKPETWIHPWAWDMILMIDILEHIPKEDGHKVLNVLKQYSRWILISTPTVLVPQNIKLYHEQEQHVCVWSLEDFESYNMDEVIENNRNLIVVLRGDLWEERPPKR